MTFENSKKKLNLNEKYPLFHWIFTLFLGPVFYFFWTIYAEGLTMAMNDKGLVFLIFALSFIYSFPSLMLYFLVFKVLEYSAFSPILLRALLLLAGSIMIAFTFYFIEGSMMRELFVTYEIAFLFPGWFLNIKIKEGKSELTPSEEN